MNMTLADIVIATPKWASVKVITASSKRKAEITIAGLTRREFDALPGKAVIVTLPDSPTRWQKRVTAQLFVWTDEPPTNQ
jgi:hypothetical protein